MPQGADLPKAKAMTEESTPTKINRLLAGMVRQDARSLTLPIVSVVGCIIFSAGAGAVWAGDRAELKANTLSREQHEQRLRDLELVSTRQTTILENMLKSLQTIERKMESQP